MEINRTTWATFALCCLTFTAPAFSQQRSRCANDGGATLGQDRPSVYLTFERAGERQPLFAHESNEGVWLRLHNDTRWAINFCTLSFYLGPKAAPLTLKDGRHTLGLRDDAEVNVCHEVEAVKSYESGVTAKGGTFQGRPVKVENIPQGYLRGDVFSTSWLPAGGSVVFSVPREHLAKHLAVYLVYKYEWESGEGISGRKEPQHRVYFRASDLPESTISKK